MRFLVDECCPRQPADALRAAGHDVRYAVDNDRRASDDALSAIAMEERRIVVTADYDFGERVIRYQQPLLGVILLGPSAEPVSVRVRRTALAVSGLGSRLEQHLTILDGERLRQRPLR